MISSEAAAARAASPISASDNRDPISAPDKASSRRGTAVAPPMPSAQAVQRPDSSSATCAAAETSAKSLRRALTSWNPTPMRPVCQTGKRISVMQEPGVIAVIIGPYEEFIRRN